jgi:hypothetical protein
MSTFKITKLQTDDTNVKYKDDYYQLNVVHKSTPELHNIKRLAKKRKFLYIATMFYDNHYRSLFIREPTRLK